MCTQQKSQAKSLPLTERRVVGVHVLGCEELADERRLPRLVHPQHGDAVLHLRRTLLLKLAAERVAVTWEQTI